MGELFRKVLTVPVLLAGLATAFVLPDILLWFRKGNTAILRAKLKVGALIVALQGVAVHSPWTAGSRYERAARPSISISTSESETHVVRLKMKETTSIAATLADARGSYSFRAARKSLFGRSTVQSGEIVANDGWIDNLAGEAVTMKVDPQKVTPGEYVLFILPGVASE